jgi:PAS domain S-box-containing protein
MLAFHLPVPIWYDWPTTLVSLLTAIVASVVALFVVSRPHMGAWRAVAGGLFMGAAIVGLHYISMAAMRLQAMHHYAPLLVMLSVVFAILFSLLSLWLTFLLRDAAGGWWVRRVGSALLMGAAITAMHYTAMAAVTFTPSATVPDLSHAVSISFLGTIGMSVVTVMAIWITLLLALVDRLREQRALLDELFEQAPQAVALLSADRWVVRVNREFTRLFGYAPHETLGRRLSELIVPDEAHDAEQRDAEVVEHEQRLEAEGIRQRKDGSRVHVAMVRVPVSVPGDQVAIYAIYQDITVRKHAEEALRMYPRRLIETQEAERQRIAREMHDEIGQVLTSA